MFFLRRPRGGHHERVSMQEEDSSYEASAANSSQQRRQPLRESDLQNALAIAVAGMESQHQSPPTSENHPEEGANPSISNNNSNSSRRNSLMSPAPASPSSTLLGSASPDAAAAVEHHFHNNTNSGNIQHHIIRTSSPTCTLLLLFFLIRLWIEAIIEKDIGLLFISLMGTVWCFRWYVIRRETEREWLESVGADNELAVEGEGGGVTAATHGSGNLRSADAAVDFDPDLGLMSFQAQLALAILESQRQMFENGGYGGNDNSLAHNGPGVTNEAKQSWDKYEWGKCGETTETLKRNAAAAIGIRNNCKSSDSKTKIGGEGGDVYGSVGESSSSSTTLASSSLQQQSSSSSSSSSSSTSTSQSAQPHQSEKEDLSSLSKLEGGLLVNLEEEEGEEPSCSICLCEYENGESVTKLPCNHIYHESCLTSWTENHVRCPLCNYDLMTGFEQPESVRQQRQNEAEQQAFRNMALSALSGRRIRARTTRRGARRASRYASALAAAEDSIV